MQKIQFSEQVIQRAGKYGLRSASTWLKSDVITAITTLESMRSLLLENLTSKYIERTQIRIQELEKELEAAGVIDDQSALQYINRVQPIYEEFKNRIDRLNEVYWHNLKSLSDEFCKSVKSP